MVIQDTVLAAYSSIIKRVRSWGLPLILITLVGTAYARFNPVVLSYFTTIELVSFHIFLGWVMCLIWLVLVYDFFFNLLVKRNESNDSSKPYNSNKGVQNGPTKLVDLLFYVLLFLICGSGLIQYSIRFTSWQLLHIHRVEVNLAHIGIAWLFISSALIKYYLMITRWLINMIRYLREN